MSATEHAPFWQRPIPSYDPSNHQIQLFHDLNSVAPADAEPSLGNESAFLGAPEAGFDAIFAARKEVQGALQSAFFANFSTQYQDAFSEA